MDLAIELDHISKTYPGTIALRDVSFGVRKGSIHGFLGPNGAGKSTCMKIICGLIQASHGQVKIMGLHQEGTNLIGFLPELPPLYFQMKVVDYLKFVKNIRTLHANKGKSVEEIMSLCGLNDVAHRAIGNLSKGYKQRVGIAQALVHGPEIIILDEPTVGLDPVAIDEIRALIKNLKHEHTVLLSTHLLNEVKILCDDITIINKGLIVESGPIEKLQKKYTPRQIISLELKTWNQSWTKEMKIVLDAEVQNEERKDETFLIEILSPEGKDLREEVSKYFINKGVGLLSMSEKEQSLEDLFKMVTREVTS